MLFCKLRADENPEFTAWMCIQYVGEAGTYPQGMIAMRWGPEGGYPAVVTASGEVALEYRDWILYPSMGDPFKVNDAEFTDKYELVEL
jgi:hypothetical protein